MGSDLSTINKPKQQFFNNGPLIEFLPNKSNWFEGENFDGVLNITIDSNGMGPCTVDILIDGFEFVWW